jgi:hypothetical protein
VTEVLILPEMEVAGEEALREGREHGLTDAEQAVAIYMAMRAVYAIAVLRNSQVIH